MTVPHPIDLVRELREALGLFAGAMPVTPRAAWEEALAEVRALRDQRTSATAAVVDAVRALDLTSIRRMVDTQSLPLDMQPWRAGLLRDIDRLIDLTAGPATACQTCGGTGLVAATPGYGGDGHEPCPDCHPPIDAGPATTGDQP